MLLDGYLNGEYPTQLNIGGRNIDPEYIAMYDRYAVLLPSSFILNARNCFSIGQCC